MTNNFGMLLSKARRAKKVTLRKLSQLVDLSPSFLSEVERGRRLPPKNESQLRDLALVLNVNENDFIEAAQKERARKNPKIFETLFNKNQDLAWGLCREAEKASEDDLEEAFKAALASLKSKGG